MKVAITLVALLFPISLYAAEPDITKLPEPVLLDGANALVTCVTRDVIGLSVLAHLVGQDATHIGDITRDAGVLRQSLNAEAKIATATIDALVSAYGVNETELNTRLEKIASTTTNEMAELLEGVTDFDQFTTKFDTVRDDCATKLKTWIEVVKKSLPGG